jgi:hypothetical protein
MTAKRKPVPDAAPASLLVPEKLATLVHYLRGEKSFPIPIWRSFTASPRKLSTKPFSGILDDSHPTSCSN